MTQYTTLIEIDSSLTIVVSEKERPEKPEITYKGRDAFENMEVRHSVDAEFLEDYTAWLKAASKYPITSKKDEELFRELAWKKSHNGHFEFPDELNQGIIIPNERVQIKSNCCGRCDGVNDECDAIDVAYFVSPIPEVVDDETQDDELKKAKDHIKDLLQACALPQDKHDFTTYNIIQRAKKYVGK